VLKISDQELKKEAKNRGYRPEMIEKVYHLLDLLEEFMAVPYEIQPELISDDKEFCNRVRLHPLLHWRKQQPKTTR
jgi:hypothetical protein